MIQELILKEEKYKDYELINSSNKLTNLNKINIFIGQNNSGKSRFLRTLFSDDEFGFKLLQRNLTSIYDLIRDGASSIRKKFDSIGIYDADGVHSELDKLAKESEHFVLGNVKNILNRIRKLGNDLLSKKSFGGWSHLKDASINAEPMHALPLIRELGYNILEEYKKLFSDDFDYPIHKIYIPILRGLRPIQTANDEIVENATVDNYKIRTLKDYKFGKGDKQENEVFTGLGIYEDSKKKLLGNKENREGVKKFEVFLSTNFFEGKDVTLTPHHDNDVLQITIDGNEKFIYDLGDGIQALIILLYPLFFNQNKNLLVFIEEPENLMHPGLQRLFIETLMKRDEFKNFQFFFTTHSNHFLDITLDYSNISIYTFHKTEKTNANESVFKVDSTSHQDIKILDLIGARTSSVFLSNCTIWVEGITDRFYLKKYLEIYQDYLLKNKSIKSLYQEDLHFSFIEYGGGNIVHWSFIDEEAFDKIKATKISSKIFLIADRDNTDKNLNSAKAARLRLLKEKLKENFFVVNGKEIENTLNGNVIIRAIEKLEGKCFDNVIYDVKKIKYENYHNEAIGTFIKTNLKKTKRNYQTKSGTIRPKLDFCKAAIESMNDISDLSKAGKKIAEELFNFIKTSNQF